MMSRRRVQASDAVELTPTDWPHIWSEGLAPLDELLVNVMTRLRVPRGTPVRLMYSSPEAAAEILGLPVGRSAAASASRLAMADLVRYDLKSHPHRALVIGSESRPTRTHVLSIADQESAVRNVWSWLTRAGLRPAQLCPSRAATLWWAAREAQRLSEPDISVHLHLGEFTTVILGTQDTRLLFIRCIDFGYNLLADALSKAGGSDSARLPSDQASTMLFESGIPLTGNSKGVPLARQALPMMQPVLQRYLVEAKQTLRFGLPSSSGEPARLLLQGPGAAIAGFSDLFVDQLQFDVALSPEDAAYAPCGPCAPRGELHSFATQASPGLSLWPAEIQQQRDYRLIRRSLIAGTTAAAFLIAADAVTTRITADRSIAQVESLRPQISRIEQIDTLEKGASAATQRLNQATTVLRTAAGDRISASGVLAELGRVQTEDVRLVNVRLSSTSARPGATLEGVAFLDGADRTTDPLEAYLETLRDSPLIESVMLSSARLARVEGRPAKRFSLQLVVVPTPLLVLAKEELP
ncbi:MAG: hypothetical protein KIT24_04180 [Phycisphaeraceae bacterium]|nr:hypothetical protein [Phycisphaeraceae bacterium]